jgi:hypothetical protein
MDLTCATFAFMGCTSKPWREIPLLIHILVAVVIFVFVLILVTLVFRGG